MSNLPIQKYSSATVIQLANRCWPSKRIIRAPIWCSVDLRDGNQALEEPMDTARKERLFRLLTKIGYREIEVGFPSASETDFAFTRHLIDQKLIPSEATIQVLTQAREHHIMRTFQAIEGAKKAIVHLYNATSALHREVVFGLGRRGVVSLAVEGATIIRECAEKRSEGDIRFEYSPECFSQTEPEFTLEICEAIIEVFDPTPEEPLIINLPATVEVAPPNCFADQVEWFIRNVSRRESLIISVHPHNDRGTAIAAAEMAMLAGCERVEGTLLGNGERTGNVDLVVLGLNLYTQGIDPGIDFSNVPEIVETVEKCTKLPVHQRHPYGGDLVFTAFSGTHQDAIRKGLNKRRASNNGRWDVPYLPVDPADIGTVYRPIIRVNSQSGKGGMAFLLEDKFGLRMPRSFEIDFAASVQQVADETGKELKADDLLRIFRREFTDCEGAPILDRYRRLSVSGGSGLTNFEFLLKTTTGTLTITGAGGTEMEAFLTAWARHIDENIVLSDIAEGRLGQDECVLFVTLAVGKRICLGAAASTDRTKAILDGVSNTLHRAGFIRDRSLHESCCSVGARD